MHQHGLRSSALKVVHVTVKFSRADFARVHGAAFANNETVRSWIRQTAIEKAQRPSAQPPKP